MPPSSTVRDGQHDIYTWYSSSYEYSIVLLHVAFVLIRGRGILYPWTGLPTKSVLAGTHVCCLRQKSNFIPFVHAETKTKFVPLLKTPGFPPKIRLPSTTNTTPVPEPR